ncbi:MAG: endolytic transglycosylase MltG [Ktedonobacterales bacterium]
MQPARTRVRRRRRTRIIVAMVVGAVALVCGTGAATAATVAINVTQPVSSSSAIVKFVVNPGDTTASVAQRLQDAGLIRNATVFRLWARYKHLDKGIKPGVYELSPNMTMNTIAVALQTNTPPQQLVTVPDALRVTQYPVHLTNLPNVNAQDFLHIVQTGQFADGTSVSSQYWSVAPKQKNAAYALEGYLYPDTYYFDTNATAQDVVTRMLDTLGEHLCPGPAGQPDAYLHDAAQCQAHAVTVGAGHINIFTAMEQRYFTNDAAQALYDTLTLSSIVTREILRQADAQSVANVYYNRYLVSQGRLQADVGTDIQADPTAQYARDTDHPPSGGAAWWTSLADSAGNVDAGSPYNTYTHPGLPPGPIAAASWNVIAAAAYPNPTGSSPYFYFLSDSCGKTHYATTNDEFNQLKNEYLGTGKC